MAQGQIQRWMRWLCVAAGCWAVIVSRGDALELPPGFVAETLATHLNAMTAMTVAADGRVFLADQTGKLLVWKEGRVLERPALTLHVADFWERGLIGVALHPEFPSKPFLFVLYVTDQPYVHHVLSRFTMTGDTADPASEKVLLEGDDQAKLGGTVPAGHQGGPLRFGSDGLLYIALGEQTAGQPSQDLNTLQGKILRIDSLGSIPEDNPFVGQTQGKYRAIYARGVRNSYGLALQRRTGRMFFTDVGGSAFEEVNELRKGANYGWPIAEGYSTNAGFVSPLFAYPPAVGQCVSGGTFYPVQAGSFPTNWHGKFFFLDYIRGWMRALDPDAPTNVAVFAKGLDGPIAVEVAPDSSLLVLSRSAWVRDGKRFVPDAGSLMRIKYTGQAAVAAGAESETADWAPAAAGLPTAVRKLPRLLSQTGLFTSLKERTASEEFLRVVPNARVWNPGVIEYTWIAVPKGSAIRNSTSNGWVFPAGSVFLRDIEWFGAATQTPIRLETRVVVIGKQGGYGATYRWRRDAQEADLVEDGDFTELDLSIVQGSGAPAKVPWYFPAAEEFPNYPPLNPAYAPNLNEAQLNGAPLGQNQLVTFSGLGWLKPPVDADSAQRLPHTVDWRQANAPPELRVRSYLDVNCASCHRPGGAARGNFDARFSTPLSSSGLIDGPLAAGDLGFSGARVIVPGEPEKSMLFQRLKRLDGFRMPPAMYHAEISPIVPVMEEWIRSLPKP